MGALHFDGIHQQGYAAAILLRNYLFSLRVYQHHYIGQSISPIEWISLGFFHHFFQRCKKSLVVGFQEPSLGGRRDSQSSFFLVFSFTNIILSIGDMSLIVFLFLCPYAQQFSCSFISQFNSQLFFYVSFSNPFPLQLSCLANPTKLVSTFVLLIQVTKEVQHRGRRGPTLKARLLKLSVKC